MANPLLLSSVFAPGHHKGEIGVQNEAEGGQKLKIVNTNENIQIRVLKLHQ